MKKNLLPVTLVIFATLGCGRTVFNDGYYKAEGDFSTIYYPLVIIKIKPSSIKTFQVDQVLGGFGAGTETTDRSANELGTVTSLESAGKGGYQGVITSEGKALRMKATYYRDANNLTGGEVKQNYLMQPISKEDAIATLRSLVKVRGSGSYSQHQEDNCQGAFALSCSEVFGPSIN